MEPIPMVSSTFTANPRREVAVDLRRLAIHKHHDLPHAKMRRRKR